MCVCSAGPGVVLHSGDGAGSAICPPASSCAAISKKQRIAGPNSIPRQNRRHGSVPLCNSRKDGTVAHSSGTAIVLYWSGSSVWLERLPVTQEVAGSSPVRTAHAMSFRATTARLAPQCAFSPLDHVRTICMSITFVWVGPV